MQRHVGQFLAEQAVRAHGSHHVVSLRADHEVVEAATLAVAHVVDGRACQLLRLREIVACGQLVVERARVHPDADGDARLAQHGIGFGQAPDVAGIDAQLRRAAFGGLDGDVRIEVDVGDHRQRRPLAYSLEHVEA